MAKMQCGVIYFVVVILIGWYIWFRDEGRDEIQDVFKEVTGKKLKLRSDEKQREFNKWWKSLSDEEQEEVIKTIQNPGGDKDELE